MAQSEKIFSCFTIDGQQVLGELVLDGEKSNLYLNSRQQIPYDPEPHTLFGETLDRKKISLHECVGYSPFPEGLHPNPVFKRVVFPHFSLIGSDHLKWEDQVFQSVSFATNDLGLMFSMRGTFGSALMESSKFDEALGATSILSERFSVEPVAIFYFAGERISYSIALPIGNFSTEVNFIGNVSDTTGISCPAETIATLTYDNPKNLDQVINDIIAILNFVTVIAGQHQGITDITATTVGSQPGTATSKKVSIHWSLAPVSKDTPITNYRDLPTTPSASKEDFDIVFVNWIKKHDEWFVARSRILHWQSQGRHYDENRLIAAANAFDILPDSTYPSVGKISAEATIKKNECKAIIKELTHGDERSQILGTLNFWGSKLRDKLLHRAKIVHDNFVGHFDDLDDVLVIALKARNFYVHGTDYGHQHYEGLTSFLTDALEFVFIASDLIECGWQASRWAGREPTVGHPLASFCYSYKSEIVRFRAAKAAAGSRN